MATEELLVLLDARTAKLDSKLKSTDQKLDKLDGSVKKTDSSLGKFSNAAGAAAGVAIKLVTAATALATVLTAVALKSAANRRELELLSKQAKTSEEDFQALAFATSRYGINAEKIADISKDIADRLGEFSAAGTGVFQDYADVMKLSKDEARAAALEFEGLSSQEVLGRMVSRMEEANVSGDKMTFVMESLGNDASKLIPLFSNNSEELLTLKKRFDDVNESLQITGTQAKALGELSNTFTLMTSSIGNATTAISATLAPVMDDFFNDIIDVVPEATQTIINFINSFLDAENISSIAGVNKEIADGNARILHLTELQEQSIGRMRKSHTIGIEQEKERLADLEKQLAVLTEQEKKIEDAQRLKGGEIGGAIGGGSGIGTGDERQAIEDRFKTEELLLGEKLQRELEVIGISEETKLNLYREYAEKLQAIKDEEAQIDLDKEQEDFERFEKRLEDELTAEQKAAKKKAKNAETLAQTEQSLNQKNAQSAMAISSAILGHDSKIGKALFLGSQALALSETFVNTQAASIKALTIDPTGALSAKVTTAGYLSMAAIAATTLGSLAGGGGGSSGGGGSIDTGGNSSQSTQQDFIPETTTLGLTSASESGSQSGTIKFATDSGDELIDTIAKMINKGQQEGRFA